MSDEDKAMCADVFNRYADKLMTYILEHVPEGREQAIAITKLQECEMWAGAAIFNSGGPDA